MRSVHQRFALVCVGFVASSCSLFAQGPLPAAASTPAPAPIGPSVRRVPPGMTYHRVWIVSPLMGSGKPGDPKRPVLVPAPPAPNAKPTVGPATAPVAATAQTGLLGFQMQVSDDGQYALAELVFATPLAFQTALKNEVAARGVSVSSTSRASAPAAPLTSAAAATSNALESALESAVPGLQIFERGQATQAQILAAFQQKKASFQFSANNSVRP